LEVKAVCGESCTHGLTGAEFPQGDLATLLKSKKRRKEEKAAVAFKKAVEQEPDNAEAHYLLGYYDENATIEERGEQMYLAYKNDKKKYLEILVYETLRDREQEVHGSALNAIKLIYDKGDKKEQTKLLKALFDAIKSKDNRDRHDAGLALAHLGNLKDGDPDRIVPELIDLLDHKRMQTRLNAVLALGEIGDKRAIEPLMKRIASGSEEKKKKRENPEVRRLAVEALGKIGKTGDLNVRQLVVEHLIELLENKGSSMRVDAIEALMELGDERAVPSLLYVLEEKGSQKVEVKF